MNEALQQLSGRAGAREARALHGHQGQVGEVRYAGCTPGVSQVEKPPQKQSSSKDRPPRAF
jgi:hypothetical protein